MNKQLSRLKIRRPRATRHSLNLHASIRAVILVGLVFVGGIGVVQQVDAAQTSASYCGKYTVSSELNACKDGIKGADCTDYAITFDEAHAQICRDASKADVSDTPTISVTPTPTPTPSSTALPTTINPTVYKNTVLAACSPYKNVTTSYNACLYGGSAQSGSTGSVPKTNQECLTNADYKNSSVKQKACIAGSTAGQKYVAEQAANSGSGANSNPFSFLDQLTQSQDLSQYVDTLHAGGQDKGTDVSEKDDTKLGSYINGAGKDQPIEVTPCTTGGKCPVILFFNGGGWHANDHTSKFVGEGNACINGDSNLGCPGAPAGGGATKRGFTVMDVTYRLGSSSVYYAYEDVMRGIQHVINNADKYNIDASKLAIWGDSAGGSLSMRAAASGKSGAKVAVGWSPPTNAFTVLFHSYKSFLIGMDHSTCIPTDLAGLTNTTDLLNGGSGDVAQYGQGLSSNNFDSITGGDGGSSDPLSLITNVLTAGQYALKTGQNTESISKQLESGGIQGLSGGIMNLASKKFGECMDNFQALSPALFASPETPPSFLAGFNNDDLIGPDQSYGMRDKLLSLGIRSEAMLLDGDPNAPPNALGATINHLGYNPRFVCATLNFVISVMNADNGQVNCDTGVADNQGSAPAAGGGGGGGGGSGNNQSTQQASGQTSEQACTSKGFTFDRSKNSCNNQTAAQICTNGGSKYDAVHESCDNTGSAPKTNDLSSYSCLNGNDVKVRNASGGVECQYNNSPYTGTKTNCTGGSQPTTQGGCAYGALQGYTRTTNVSSANCKGIFANPGGLAGNFSGDCYTK